MLSKWSVIALFTIGLIAATVPLTIKLIKDSLRNLESKQLRWKKFSKQRKLRFKASITMFIFVLIELALYIQTFSDMDLNNPHTCDYPGAQLYAFLVISFNAIRPIMLLYLFYCTINRYQCILMLAPKSRHYKVIVFVEGLSTFFAFICVLFTILHLTQSYCVSFAPEYAEGFDSLFSASNALVAVYTGAWDCVLNIKMIQHITPAYKSVNKSDSVKIAGRKNKTAIRRIYIFFTLLTMLLVVDAIVATVCYSFMEEETDLKQMIEAITSGIYGPIYAILTFKFLDLLMSYLRDRPEITSTNMRMTYRSGDGYLFSSTKSETDPSADDF